MSHLTKNALDLTSYYSLTIYSVTAQYSTQTCKIPTGKSQNLIDFPGTRNLVPGNGAKNVIACRLHLPTVSGKSLQPHRVVGGKELREGAVTYSQLSPFKLSPRLAKGGGP